MRFAYAGTPALSARVLKMLAHSEHTPCLVISQPDKPYGRGRSMKSPPVLEAANGLGVAALQTPDISSPDVIRAIRASGAAILVVVAFGQLLKAPLLETLPCVNVHASLLPAYRGAAPIARAIMAGEEETGVCIMRMTPGLDEGPVGLFTRVAISLRDDAGSLETKLANLGAVGLAQVMTGLEDGNVTWTEQRGPATYAPKITAADRLPDFGRSARQVHDRVRALSPESGCDVVSGGLRLKLWRTWPYGVAGCVSLPPELSPLAGRPGRLGLAGERLFAGCGEGAVELLLIQPAGKKRMRVTDFLRGYRQGLGEIISPGTTTNAGSEGTGQEE